MPTTNRVERQIPRETNHPCPREAQGQAASSSPTGTSGTGYQHAGAIPGRSWREVRCAPSDRRCALPLPQTARRLPALFCPSPHRRLPLPSPFHGQPCLPAASRNPAASGFLPARVPALVLETQPAALGCLRRGLGAHASGGLSVPSSGKVLIPAAVGAPGPSLKLPPPPARLLWQSVLTSLLF